MPGSENIKIIIPAAGAGTRTGSGKPKQYIDIAGKPLLRHTVERLHIALPHAQFYIMINPDYQQEAQSALAGFQNVTVYEGGKSRKESVYKGLRNISHVKDDDCILIHDAARPFVSDIEIKSILKTLQAHEAATLCAWAYNTMCKPANNQTIDTYEDRTALRHILTPQAFRYKTLKDAHEKFKDREDFTDDASLVHAMGIEVALTKGSQHNFKITTAEDLELAETLLSAQRQTRTGMGFDVHAFDDAPAETIRLGGIDVPFDKPLKGHSDADVVLHTVTDALLGAFGAGDIGEHFPPTDHRWKGKDSAYFLDYARNMLRERNGTISNVDVTVICEAPKLGPYKEAMGKRMAEILDIQPCQINLKATTTETLGFTGRGEGIAAQAVVNIEMPRGAQ